MHVFAHAPLQSVMHSLLHPPHPDPQLPAHPAEHSAPHPPQQFAVHPWLHPSAHEPVQSAPQLDVQPKQVPVHLSPQPVAHLSPQVFSQFVLQVPVHPLPQAAEHTCPHV